MNALLTAIVSAVAAHGIDGVDSDAEFRRLAEEHRGDSGFDAAVNQVSKVFEPLERSLQGQTHVDQIALALQLFYSCRKEKGLQEICRELTRSRYASFWSGDQQRYYEEVSEKLEHWRDYFLSFTNYNPTQGEAMFVNNQHSLMISLGLGRAVCFPETKETNLLALLLDYTLSNWALNGFYYPKARDSEDVQARLQHEARSALVFVQLLQNSMFDNQTNYCLYEFDAAQEDESRAFIFIMTVPRVDFIRREDVELRMFDWHDAIMRRAPIELKPTINEDQAWEQLDEIKERLVASVKAARHSLYENVPV
jgi:hypothetical protein